MIFAVSFDPDQAQQNVRPDLDPKLVDTLIVLLKEVFEKVDFEKNICREQKTIHEKLPSIQRVKDIKSYYIPTHRI